MRPAETLHNDRYCEGAGRNLQATARPAGASERETHNAGRVFDAELEVLVESFATSDEFFDGTILHRDLCRGLNHLVLNPDKPFLAGTAREIYEDSNAHVGMIQIEILLAMIGGSLLSPDREQEVVS